ncbi:MAG: HmuY family protein [Ginsengibacter sp.]
MNTKIMKLSALAMAILVTGLVSCGKEEVPANPPAPSITVTDSMEIPFSTSHYALYSFKDSSQVSLSDSASLDWDFGLRFVSIIVNSHASGPGNGGVITQDGVFDSYTTAPTTGYAFDTTATNLAIDNSFTTGWYNYDDNTHAFSPKAGKFFVIKTADGHYAKMEILSVNYAGLRPPNPTPDSLIYKFRYTYQADGSVNF